MRHMPPTPLLLELLEQRYPKGISLWSLGAPIRTEIAYCEEFVARGFMVGTIFHVTSWDIVVPQSIDRQRLDKALMRIQELEAYSEEPL